MKTAKWIAPAVLSSTIAGLGTPGEANAMTTLRGSTEPHQSCQNVQWLPVVGFAETGCVAPGYDPESLQSSIKWDLNLRAWAEGIEVRMDAAWSEEGGGLRIMAGSPSGSEVCSMAGYVPVTSFPPLVFVPISGRQFELRKP